MYCYLHNRFNEESIEGKGSLKELRALITRLNKPKE